MRNKWTVQLCMVAAFLTASAAPGAAQTVPWDVFADIESGSVCDVVNAANAELVVLSASGRLTIVTGQDTILADLIVAADATVSLGGLPVGVIEFATDGDGFRTLWWTSITGRVINVDAAFGVPTESALFPSDLFDVPCDACPFWDDPTVCDGDLDGVQDGNDLCSDTPPAVIVDATGCWCGELDDDDDFVDNCDDLCPGTPASEAVDVDGCSVDQQDDDFDGVPNGDDFCAGTPLDAPIDSDGCWCGQLDDDEDAIDNCDDLCPGTAALDNIDLDGCSAAQLDGGSDGPPAITVNFCGMNAQVGLALTAVGLMMTSLVRRRGS